MPIDFVAPEKVMTVNGAPIYRHYRDMDANKPSEHWYNTDECESEECLFDVRDLPVPIGVAVEQHALIIARAMDNGLIRFPVELAEEGPQAQAPVVRGRVGTPEQANRVDFDAAQWVLHASVDDLVGMVKAGCEGTAEAGAVAEFMQNHDYRVAGFFYSLANECRHNWQASINEEEALSLLKEERPEVYGELLCQLNRAVRFSGFVTESLIIQKSVDVIVPLDDLDTVIEEMLIKNESGETVLDIPAMREYTNLNDLAETAIREAAYLQTINDGDHGWEGIDCESVEVAMNNDEER